MRSRMVSFFCFACKARKSEWWLRAFFFLLLVSAAGCANLGIHKNLLAMAERLGTGHHQWQLHRFDENLPLRALMRTGAKKSDLLRVYIEGDGRAWLDRSIPSPDPTPKNPVALHLALLDPAPHVAYLARPCQYIDTDERGTCNVRYWTSKRFAPEVVTVMNDAISKLKKISGAVKISLVGFSGGGAIAALVAAGRDDVLELITVAGVLDHTRWTELHGVVPLAASLNPVDVAGRLSGIRQLHFTGRNDRIVTPETNKRYFERLDQKSLQLVMIDKQAHLCCWDKIWPDLLTSYALNNE